MAVVLRLKRIGRKNRSAFRLSAMDKRAPRDGNTLETLGFYDPAAPRKELQVKLDPERCKHWLGVGASCSDTVASILRRGGVQLPVRKSSARPGRKRATKRRAARDAAQSARLSRKQERATQRAAAKQAAAGAAKAEAKS
jgi:small subunit ribosomal protein S16